MSRRNKRKNPLKTPPSQRNGNGPERTYQFTEPPPPPPAIDFSRMRIGDGPNQPPPEAEGDGTAKAGFGSRGDRLRDGLRSRLLFPDLMKQAIDERTVAFGAQILPRTELEKWLASQIARGSVQSDLAGDQLLVSQSLAAERVDTRWPDDRREHADKLGERVSKSPCRIARELGRSKYGALYLIDKLTSLSESIAANGGLLEEQRDYLFDLLGIDPILRNGSARVPVGNDGPALAAVVETERARLTTKLERELDARDLQEQAAARLGIVRYQSIETQKLRSDQRRADRRVNWAWQTLAQLRAGVDPATLIDPETGRPIDPGTPAAPAPEAAAPAPPPPTSSTPEPSPATFQMPPMPEGWPKDVKQMCLLLGEAYLRTLASSDAETSQEPPPAPAG